MSADDFQKKQKIIVQIANPAFAGGYTETHSINPVKCDQCNNADKVYYLESQTNKILCNACIVELLFGI